MDLNYENRKKGNLAEKIVALLLDSLPEVDRVSLTSDQDDSNHWDMMVTLQGDHSVFAVQAKALSESNLSLQIRHINDWLDAKPLTVMLWADVTNGTVFWADILHKLIESGGMKDRKTIRFNLQRDLKPLHKGDSAENQPFLRWVRVFARMWPQIRRPSTAQFLLSPEFSSTLLDAIRDPDILAFLPTAIDLILTIRDYRGKEAENLVWLNNTIFETARRSLQSPIGAAGWLATQLGLPVQDLDVMSCLEKSLLEWSEQISRDKKAETSGMLWAYSHLAPLLSYAEGDDFLLPAFTTKYAWPMRRLMGLLPLESVVDPLTRILRNATHPDTLLHAAYYFGTLPFQSNARVWEHIESLRVGIRHRKENIGPLWPAVDRQLLYEEVHTGSEEARDKLLRLYSNENGLQFDAPFNFHYYRGNMDLIHSVYRSKLESSLDVFRFERGISTMIYDSIRRILESKPQALEFYDPGLWPTT